MGDVVAQFAGHLPFVTSDTIDVFIRPPALGDKAGALGAIALAMDARDDAGLR